MYKKSIVLVLLLSSLFSFSQDIVTSIPLDLKKDRDVFQIVDETNKDVMLFVSDKYKVKAIHLNDKMEVTDSLSNNRPDKKYSDMIGYSRADNAYSLFWASGNTKEIYSQVFDFEKRNLKTFAYSLPFKNERILQKFTQNNIFYILTILKNSNVVKLYTFGKGGQVNEKEIDLTGFKFFKSDFKRSTFYSVLEENLLPFEAAFSLQRISSESPTSLTFSSKKRKCYSKGNEFIITIDTNLGWTQMIVINLKDLTAKESIITQPFIEANEFVSVNSNSFLHDDKIFQIKLSADILKFCVKDFNGNTIKEYSVTAEEPMTFKNSEIHQENGSASNHRVLDKTSQFLRKVNNSNVGVSCYNVNNHYMVTMGSVTEDRSNNTGAMVGAAMLGGVAGVLIASAIMNPTYENFNSYADRKVVYINCLLNKDATHLNGEVKDLAFDKIRKFMEENKKLSSQTLFKLDNYYYLGFYNTFEKTYKLRKFED